MTNSTSSTRPVPNLYRASASDFKKIPGSPIAYWMNNRVYDVFERFDSFIKKATACQGLATTDNNRFVRNWSEVIFSSIGFGYGSTSEAMESKLKWFPFDKGGPFRKWYGNNDYVVNWYNDGEEIRHNIINKYPYLNGNPDFVAKNPSKYFLKGITWGKVTTGTFSARFSPSGAIFSDAGMKAFANSDEELHSIIGFFNSKVSPYFLSAISETINFEQGNIARLPYKEIITHKVVEKLILIAKKNWDTYETSWDFTTLPLLQSEYHHPTLRETYAKLRVHWKEMTLEMQQLEEENNRIFIEAYGLQDELSPDVPLSEITLTCNPYYRYNGDRSKEELESLLLMDTIKEFISYAVGCMFGRYSLDKPGLVLANQGEKIEDYLEQVPEPSFMPDADNIIPLLEDEYFEDDIVGRFKEFLKVTFGEDTLSENLDFIAEALGSNGKKSSEGVIRDYFLKSFYKDHMKMYKKRPIYWLFSSGKGRAFNALIYMHRYNKETLALMRTDYLLELEGKLDARKEMIKSDIGKYAQEKARLGKMIDEIMEYDELLKNKADEYIEIDLDDGVKVNYERFEGLVEKI